MQVERTDEFRYVIILEARESKILLGVAEATEQEPTDLISQWLTSRLAKLIALLLRKESD